MWAKIRKFPSPRPSDNCPPYFLISSLIPWILEVSPPPSCVGRVMVLELRYELVFMQFNSQQVSNFADNMDYSSRLEALTIESLYKRRLYADLIFAYKVFIWT